MVACHCKLYTDKEEKKTMLMKICTVHRKKFRDTSRPIEAEFTVMKCKTR